MKRAKKDRNAPGKQLRITKRRLDELVEEAIVDCYGESEEVSGPYTMLEDNLALPFQTQVLGTTVTVERIDLTDRDVIVAICRSGRERQRVSLLDLPLPSPPPAGAEWIAAYRHWAKAGRTAGLEDEESGDD